ncbi:unnamed protein product, partial [Brassica napus]
MAEEAMVSIIFHETNGWEGDLQHVLYINYGAGDVSSDPDAAASVIICFSSSGIAAMFVASFA